MPLYLYYQGQHCLLWSSYGKPELGYQGGYTINITRAHHLQGPWSPSEVIFDQNTGHASLFMDRNGEYCLCAHNNDTLHGNEHPVICKLTEILKN